MNLEGIIKDVATIISAALAIISFTIAFIKNAKAKYANKESTIKDIAREAIIAAEKLYDVSKDALKAAGINTGELKFNQVIGEIKSACQSFKLNFDVDYWTKYIESEVAVINATKVEEETL